MLKNYLMSENDRNKTHAAMYTKMLQIAFGQNAAIIIGHHLTFENNGDLNTENEIPSADCLLFDHPAMTTIFGSEAQRIMVQLALVPCEERETIVERELINRENKISSEDYTTKQWIIEQSIEREVTK